LTELQERDSSLAIRDSSHTELSGDGISFTRRGSTMDKKQKGATNGDSKKWIIPLFPSGWRHAVGNKIFNHMIAWRTDAAKGRTQEQLSEKFDLKVERFDKTKSKTNKRKA